MTIQNDFNRDGRGSCTMYLSQISFDRITSILRGSRKTNGDTRVTGLSIPQAPRRISSQHNFSTWIISTAYYVSKNITNRKRYDNNNALAATEFSGTRGLRR